MQKTVLVAIVMLAFAFSAAAQANKDSLQNRQINFAPLRDSSVAKPFFLPSVIPANFYASHLPFFCDKELKLQKAVNIPVKFRLGSVEDCDKLEGKH